MLGTLSKPWALWTVAIICGANATIIVPLLPRFMSAGVGTGMIVPWVVLSYPVLFVGFLMLGDMFTRRLAEKVTVVTIWASLGLTIILSLATPHLYGVLLSRVPLALGSTLAVVYLADERRPKAKNRLVLPNYLFPSLYLMIMMGEFLGWGADRLIRWGGDGEWLTLSTAIILAVLFRKSVASMRQRRRPTMVKEKVPVHWAGVFSLILTILSFLWFAIESLWTGWNSTATTIAIGAFLLALSLFVFSQLLGDHSFLSLKELWSPRVGVGLLASFMVQCAFAAFMLAAVVIPHSGGQNPNGQIISGLIPAVAGFLAAAILSPRAAKRYTLVSLEVAGIVFIGAGLVQFWLVGPLLHWIPLMVAGFGLGIFSEANYRAGSIGLHVRDRLKTTSLWLGIGNLGLVVGGAMLVTSTLVGKHFWLLGVLTDNVRYGRFFNTMTPLTGVTVSIFLIISMTLVLNAHDREAQVVTLKGYRKRRHTIA